MEIYYRILKISWNDTVSKKRIDSDLIDSITKGRLLFGHISRGSNGTILTVVVTVYMEEGWLS